MTEPPPKGLQNYPTNLEEAEGLLALESANEEENEGESLPIPLADKVEDKPRAASPRSILTRAVSPQSILRQSPDSVSGSDSSVLGQGSSSREKLAPAASPRSGFPTSRTIPMRRTGTLGLGEVAQSATFITKLSKKRRPSLFTQLKNRSDTAKVKKQLESARSVHMGSQMHGTTDTQTDPKERMQSAVRRVMLYSHVNKHKEKRRKNLESKAIRDRHAVEDVAHNRCVFFPDTKKKRYWDLWVAALLVFQIFFVPLRLGFLITWEYDVVDGVCDIFFVIDIILNFFQAYIDPDKGWVTNKRSIAQNYLTSWFAIDFISTFPLYLFVPDQAGASSMKFSRSFRLFRLSRLTKMLRVARLEKLMQHTLYKNAHISSVYRICKLLFIVLLTSHLSACFWFFIASSFEYSGDTGYIMIDENLIPESWVIAEGYSPLQLAENKNLGSLYVTSLYFSWATLTSVGYGDVRPYNDGEKIFAIVIMIVGVGFLAYTTATLTSILATADLSDAKYRDQKAHFDMFLRRSMLPQALGKRIKQHFKFSMKAEQDIMDFRHILEQMPTQLQISIAHTINWNIISAVSFLKDVSRKDPFFIPKFFSVIHLARYEASEFVCLKGQTVRELFICKSGKLFVLDKTNKRSAIYPGMMFGQDGILGNTALHAPKTWQFSYFTVVPVETIVVSKGSFCKLMSEHPIAHKEFKDFVEKDVSRNEEKKENEEEREEDHPDLVLNVASGRTPDVFARPGSGSKKRRSWTKEELSEMQEEAMRGTGLLPFGAGGADIEVPSKSNRLELAKLSSKANEPNADPEIPSLALDQDKKDNKQTRPPSPTLRSFTLSDNKQTRPPSPTLRSFTLSDGAQRANAARESVQMDVLSDLLQRIISLKQGQEQIGKQQEEIREMLQKQVR